MGDKRSEYTHNFNFFACLFIFTSSIALSLHAISISGGGDIMLPFAWIFGALALISGAFAVHFGIKAFITPKDTRLDDLITKVDNLIANQVDKDTMNKLTKATEELTEELREGNKGK